MAKKFLNVVYRVEDKELTAAKNTVNQLKQATDQSAVAMTKMSNTAVTGGKQASNTIAGMTLQMQQLRAQIELTDRADTKRLTQLKSQYQQLRSQIQQFNATLDQTGNSLSRGYEALMSFRNVAVSVFAGVMVQGLVRTNLELARLQGQVEGVERAFKRAFPNSAQVMNDLRKATHGTVTDFELMQRTLQATNLGVSIEHLATLFEFAAARAQQTGESVDYLVDSIVRGIGRKSVLVLDNLGLSTTRLKAQFGGVAIASKSVAEVTEGVAAIAKVELEKMGGYSDTAETKVKRLEVAWKQLRIEIANKLDTETTTGFLGNALEGLTRMIVGSEEMNKRAIRANANLIASEFKTKEALQQEIEFREKNYNNTRWQLLNIALKQKELLGGPGGLTHAEVAENDALKEQYKELTRVNDGRSEAIKVLKEYLAVFDKTKNAGPGKSAPGLIEVLTDQIENLQDQVKKATSEDQIGVLNTQIGELQDKLKGLQNYKVDTDPFVKLGEQSKKGLDVVIDNAEASGKDLNELLKEVTKENEDVIKAGYDQQQRDQIEHAEITLQNEKDAAEERKRVAKEEADYKRQLQSAAVGYGLSSLQRVLEYTFLTRENDLQNLENYYDRLLDAAGNNEEARKKIERKKANEIEKARQRQAIQDREDALTKIAIDTAVGVIRALITPPVPNFPLAGLVAGAGLVEAATVKSVSGRSLKSRAYAEGEVDIDGPGTTKSDSIPAWLSKHESVINAEATLASKNLLQAINDRKIDDRILSVARDGGSQINVFDDSKIVKAIQGSKMDLVKQGYTLYTVHQEGSNLRRVIRSKIQGY